LHKLFFLIVDTFAKIQKKMIRCISKGFISACYIVQTIVFYGALLKQKQATLYELPADDYCII